MLMPIRLVTLLHLPLLLFLWLAVCRSISQSSLHIFNNSRLKVTQSTNVWTQTQTKDIQLHQIDENRNLEMAFCDPFPIVWRYCMVLDSVVCYCMVILWHYMVYHVSISWYWMVLYDVAMVKYIDLPTEGPRSQNQIIIFETWHKPLFACWPILQSHFLLFYKKKAPPLAGSDGQKQIF